MGQRFVEKIFQAVAIAVLFPPVDRLVKLNEEPSPFSIPFADPQCLPQGDYWFLCLLAHQSIYSSI